MYRASIEKRPGAGNLPVPGLFSIFHAAKLSLANNGEDRQPALDHQRPPVLSSSPIKVFEKDGGELEGEPFSKKVSLPASVSFFKSAGACFP